MFAFAESLKTQEIKLIIPNANNLLSTAKPPISDHMLQPCTMFTLRQTIVSLTTGQIL